MKFFGKVVESIGNIRIFVAVSNCQTLQNQPNYECKKTLQWQICRNRREWQNLYRKQINVGCQNYRQDNEWMGQSRG